MKILFIPSIPFSVCYGGAEVQVQKTKEYLEKRDHEVKIINFEDRDLIDWADVVHFFGGWGVGTFMWARLIVGKKPIVFSTIFYWNSFIKKLFIKISSYFPDTRSAWFKKALISSNILLPNSESEAQLLKKLFSVRKEKIEVINNGVELNFIGKNPDDFKNKYLGDWLKNREFVFSAQRIEKRKNTLNLIKACIKLNIPLVVAGKGEKEEKYIKEVEKLTEDNKNLIKLLGQISREDLKNAYAAAKVHALSSYFETPGIVNLEAGLNGANLVIGDSKPTREYFDDIAWLCKQDVENIASAIKEAMSASRNNFNQSKKIAEKYSWEIAAEKTEKAYLKAIKDFSKK